MREEAIVVAVRREDNGDRKTIHRIGPEHLQHQRV